MGHGTTDKRFTQPLGGAGGGLILTAKGGLHTFDTGDAELAVGTDGQILTADSAEATGLKWATSSAAGLTFNSIDTPPISPDPLNDEFDDGVLDAAWTVFNAGSLVTTESAAGKYLHLTTPGAVGPDVRGYSRTPPTAPYTFTVKCALGGELVANGTAGIGFRESATGELLQIYLVNFAADTAIEVTKWASPTVFSSTPFLAEQNSNTQDAYFQIEDDTTDLIVRFGDGKVWTEVFREPIGTFLTPDEVIVAITQVGTNPGRDTEGVFYWSRFNWDADDSLVRDVGGGAGEVPADSRIANIYSRPSTETPHADDEEFDDALGGTAVEPSGTTTWLQEGHLLSLEFENVTAQDIVARVYPLTPSAAPVTIQSLMNLELSDADFHQAGILFADGTTATDNVVVFSFHRANVILINRGTYTNINNTELDSVASSGIGRSEPYLRGIWSAANSWKIQISSDGKGWTDFGLGTEAFTMTPTHFGVWGTSWGSALRSAVSWEYLRVDESDLSL